MTMTPSQIICSYREAKYPTGQITILSQLNQCSTNDIVAILADGGIIVDGNIKPKYNCVTLTPKAEQALITMYNSGVQIKDIAKAFKMAKSTTESKLRILRRQNKIGRRWGNARANKIRSIATE